MQIIETSLPGVLVVKPRVFTDPRGFFMETYRAERAGRRREFASALCRTTIRIPRAACCAGCTISYAHPQAKLCRVTQGEVLDIAVDVRLGSPNFGKWVSVLLSGDNHLQLYVPKGFAHGFVVRSETADFLYKCSDYFDASDDRGVLWNDPDIGIDWQTPSPILSDKDQRYLPLSQIAHDQLPRYQP